MNDILSAASLLLHEVVGQLLIIADMAIFADLDMESFGDHA
jgi:hypothetical protein